MSKDFLARSGAEQGKRRKAEKRKTSHLLEIPEPGQADSMGGKKVTEQREKG